MRRLEAAATYIRVLQARLMTAMRLLQLGCMGPGQVQTPLPLSALTALAIVEEQE